MSEMSETIEQAWARAQRACDNAFGHRFSGATPRPVKGDDKRLEAACPRCGVWVFVALVDGHGRTFGPALYETCDERVQRASEP